MEDQEFLLSKEKQTELAEELHYLKSIRRKEIAEGLEYAKSLGDLSENAEYHEARSSQAETEERISKLETILKHARIVHHTEDGTVSVGSTVLVQKKGATATREYHIVGSEESDLLQGRISHTSPLGRAIIGKKKGDAFTFSTPAGDTIHYTILEVR